MSYGALAVDELVVVLGRHDLRADDATLADGEGTAAPAGALALSDSSFTLAAGASRTVTLTLTPDPLPIGHWTGLVTATTPGGPVRSAVSFVKEREKYTDTLVAIGRDGAPRPIDVPVPGVGR